MTTHGIRNCRLVTMEEGLPVHDRGALVWDEDGTLLAVGDEATVAHEHPGTNWRDMAGRMVMPGLVCAHTHFYGVLSRGVALKDAPPEDFVQILERLWWRLDRALDDETVELSALVAMVDGIRGGTTTAIDHHASPSAVAGSLDLVAGAARRIGMRVCTCYEVSDRDGTAVRDAGVAENVRFLQAFPPGSDPAIAAAFGLHASFTVGDETLERVAAALPEGAGIHIHCCEAASDAEASVKQFGARPVARLDRFGLLDGNSLLAHGVHLTSDEMDLVADRGARLLHNPMSNMNNAVGVAPILEFRRRGITVALGSDGYSSSMFDEMAVCGPLHRLTAGSPRVAFADAFDMLFRVNPALASGFFSRPVGVLEAGAGADFIVLPYEPPTPMTSGNLVGHALFGFSRLQPDEVVIDGVTVFRDGSCTTVDEAEVAARAREATKKLWERF